MYIWIIGRHNWAAHSLICMAGYYINWVPEHICMAYRVIEDKTGNLILY